MGKPSYGEYKWCLESKNSRQVPGRANKFVKCVHFRSFKIDNGSGYDSIYYHFEVLKVDATKIVGPELFAYLAEESEWTGYLSGK